LVIQIVGSSFIIVVLIYGVSLDSDPGFRSNIACCGNDQAEEARTGHGGIIVVSPLINDGGPVDNVKVDLTWRGSGAGDGYSANNMHAAGHGEVAQRPCQRRHIDH
jgi:hypothetical protein